MKGSSYDYEDEFYCTKCGNRQKFNIPRPISKQRPAGHLKRMYCFTCKKERNFVECKPFASKYSYQDFLLELYCKNFDEDGNRKEDYGVFKNKVVNVLNKHNLTIESFLRGVDIFFKEEK